MSLTILSFQVNGQRGTALTDSRALRLSLAAEGPARSVRCTVTEDGAPVWDSGELPWQPHQHFEDLPLEPCRRYAVTAVVSAGEEQAQAACTLYTGLMDTPWQGQWIEPEQESAVKERPIQFFEQFVPMPDHLGGHDRLRPAQELRRVFTLSELPRRAMLYASAHGVYALYLNGKRVDPRRLAPETTPYQTMLYYQAYDLTALLLPGENTLRVLLGDGWWIGRIGITGDSCQYGDRLAFLGQLELSYPGRTERIVTDGAFEARPSHIRYADLFMGEKWDLNAPAGEWRPCVPLDTPTDHLTAQPMAPVGVWTELEPAAILTTPKGELVVDFGQCMAGVVRLRLACPAGREVTLDHSETLDPDGNFFRNILGRNKDQQDKVICGPRETEFCPEFTYHGFRYLRITGATQSELRSVRALAIGTPLEPLGEFSCSDPRLQQLQHNIRWSTRSNMVSVPTDCPQREKAGWTGDILAFAPTGCFNYDLDGFLRAWLGQMRLEQTEDGGIPIVIPSYPAQTEMQRKTFGGNTSAAWSDACVLVPLELYKSTGDLTVLRENQAMMKRWLGFIAAASHEHLWTEGYHFGDWLIPSYQHDPEAGTAATDKVIAACQYAVTVSAYLEVLEALEAPEGEKQAYRTLLADIRRAVRARFVREDGTVEGDLQGLYVMVLFCGAVDGELARKVTDRLVRLIEENGGHLDTGFVSVPHLLDVLADNGREDLACQLLFQTESPSWLYQVAQGATTMWENWNAIRPDGTVTTSSFNHYALGCVGDWMYRKIGGLNRRGPGWSAVEFAPAVHCGLDWAQCSHRTPYGLISCRWERGEGGVTVAVRTPVPARLTLPGLDRELAPGSYTFQIGEA